MAKKSSTPKPPDWEKIAKTACGGLVFALEHLKPISGMGTLYNSKTGKTRAWQDKLIETIQMIPGLKMDREAVFACQLPRKERNAWFKKNRPHKAKEPV